MRGRLDAIMRQLCPICRRGRVFRGRLAMNASCPNCALRFEREPGYFVGAMYLSYGLCVPLLACLALVVHLARPTWGFEAVLLSAALLSCPFLPSLFRYSRVLWLHLDRGLDPED